MPACVQREAEWRNPLEHADTGQARGRLAHRREPDAARIRAETARVVNAEPQRRFPVRGETDRRGGAVSGPSQQCDSAVRGREKPYTGP